MEHNPNPQNFSAIPRPVIYAPLAGCSDFAFRQMVRRYFDGLIYCEMVKMDALVRTHERTLSYLNFSEEMHPIGAQLCGAKPELAGDSARIIEDRGFDVVDLNCGCPVDKVTKDGSGSGLLKQPDKIGEILRNMVEAVDIPVTVKIRAGWDSEEINAPEVVKIAEEAGAKLIGVHGRTRAQAYKGLADRDVIRECVEAATTIKVAGNGDIFDAASALHMFEHTGCDYVLCSRGAMGQPWIGEDILRALEGKPPLERNYLQTLLDHIDCIEAEDNPRKARVDIRRVGCWYCKAAPHISDLRKVLSRSESVQEAREHIRSFQETVPLNSAPQFREKDPDQIESCSV